MKTFLTRSMLGIFFGGFLAVVMAMAVIYIGGNATLDADLFVKNALAAMFCGWFFTVTPLYFEHDNWSLLRQTLYHFATVIVLYFVVAFGVGWIKFTFVSFAAFLGLFLVVYAIIWTAFYLYFRNEAKKLNEGLDGL